MLGLVRTRSLCGRKLDGIKDLIDILRLSDSRT
jgi:hypothetical protein